jgi:hypothetical protein
VLGSKKTQHVLVVVVAAAAAVDGGGEILKELPGNWRFLSRMRSNFTVPRTSNSSMGLGGLEMP